MIHALAILAISTRVIDNNTTNNISTIPYNTIGNIWFAGTILFSGSIYGLALGGSKLLGPVTPIGGLLLMTGWGALCLGTEGNNNGKKA